MRAAYSHDFLLVCGVGSSPILPEVGLGTGAHVLPRADMCLLGSHLAVPHWGPSWRAPLPIALVAPKASWLLQLSWKLGPQVGRFWSMVYREGWEVLWNPR